MKTPEQWISNYRLPQWSRDWIIAIQADAREGMVPAVELRPTIELLRESEFHFGLATCMRKDLHHRCQDELTRLETLLGEKGGK